MITMQMAYLSLCKLKQKWLQVTPFMSKKKKVIKAGENKKWEKTVSFLPPTPGRSQPLTASKSFH